MIDIHTHLAYHEIYPSAYLSGMLSSGSGTLPKDKIHKLLQAFLRDKVGTQHVKQMDRAGIEKSILLIIDGGLGMEEPELTLEEIYRLHFEVLKQYPDRFVVFAGIDPKRGRKGFELFQKSIETYGFKGLKLYPPMGYAMDNPDLFKYYEICNENHFPVLIHTGPSLASLQNHYANVHNALPIAQKYPNINFILAHAGYQLEQPFINELSSFPNVFFDIAGIQTLLTDRLKMKKIIPQIFSPKFVNKVVFGSDWPLFNLTNSIEKHIYQLIELAKENGIEQVEIKKVFEKNAKKILKL